MRTTLALFICAIVVAGCQTAPSAEVDKPIAETVDTRNADYGPYPQNYRLLVKAWFADNLKDPESARYKAISSPRKEFMIENLKPFYGYSVCATVNAKNAYGGYTGNKTFWFMIRDGKIARAQNTDGYAGSMISRGHFVNCKNGGLNGETD